MNSRKRHILKTITWRIISMISSFFIGWYVTEEPTGGLKTSGWVFLINSVLYYFHERAWHNYKEKLKIKREATDNISGEDNI